MGLWTMLAFCQDAGSSIPLIPSYLHFINGNTLSKDWFSSCRVQNDVKDKYLVKSLLSVSNIWFPHSLYSSPSPISYKQEDCYNLPCLSILTSSITEIRYEIKLTSNQKVKKNKLDVQKNDYSTSILLLHASSSKRKRIESSIPTYTHWAREKREVKCSLKHTGMSKQERAKNDINTARFWTTVHKVPSACISYILSDVVIVKS